VDNRYVLISQVAFDAAHAKLRLKHADVVADHERKIEEYNALLNEPADEIAFKEIPEDLIPDDISVGQLNGIFDLIKQQ
jgi:hypothetical protein